MAVASCVFLAPLLSLKSLKTLAPMSTASMVVAGTFMLTMFMLAVDAVATGRAADFRWLPSGKALGGSPGRMVINLLAVLPVILMAFVCQYNVLPIVSVYGWCMYLCCLYFLSFLCWMHGVHA
jgi:amino acid permease